MYDIYFTINIDSYKVQDVFIKKPKNIKSNMPVYELYKNLSIDQLWSALIVLCDL